MKMFYLIMVILGICWVLSGLVIPKVGGMLANIVHFVSTVFIPGLLAYFTHSLWRATEKYTEVTKKLLEQSRRAFTDQKKASETDVISKIVFSGIQLKGNKHTEGYAKGFVNGMCEALNVIDPHTFREVIKGLKAWRQGKGAENFRWLFEEALERKK